MNIINEELQSVEKVLFPVEKKVDKENHESKLSTPAKVFFGAMSPLWVPVGVAGFILGMPVLGAIMVKHKITQFYKLEEYRNHPCHCLEEKSKIFLASITYEDVFKYAERQMENTSKLLSEYASEIPMLIEADKKMVFQLLSETRTKEELSKLYTPVIQDGFQLRQNIIPALGIELCPATVDECDIKWKNDKNSCLGEGEFSLVYHGELKNSGMGDIPVAVKVFKRPFDDLNSRFYLYDETTIR